VTPALGTLGPEDSEFEPGLGCRARRAPLKPDFTETALMAAGPLQSMEVSGPVCSPRTEREGRR
jgi:hypothetical protein